jgi:2-keto-3-deoxy-L-rhamnonate aldolase RhmA
MGERPIRNEVKVKVEAGTTVFGSYALTPSAAMVETLALAGLDFVRLDPYHINMNRETIEDMTRAAFAMDVMAWARVRNDPWEIATTLDAGVMAVTIPNIGTVQDAKRAVLAARYPPHGERENGRPARFRKLPEKEYLDWAEREIWVSIQIEGLDGVENFREIVKVEGVHCVQTGRGDLSNALGLPGGRMHPKVLEIERQIVEAAFAAGKHVSLNTDVTPGGLEYVQGWMERGVRIFTIGPETSVIINAFGTALAQLRKQPVGT